MNTSDVQQIESVLDKYRVSYGETFIYSNSNMDEVCVPDCGRLYIEPLEELLNNGYVVSSILGDEVYFTLVADNTYEVVVPGFFRNL